MDKRKLGGSARHNTMKSTISNAFKELEECGFFYKNFNSNKRVRTAGWIDIFVSKNRAFFIEVKIGNDTLSGEQFDTAHKLQRIKNDFYFMVNEKNYLEIRDLIISVDNAKFI